MIQQLNNQGAVPTVVLPCPPDQFRDFIAGLLGRAQTIETSVAGPFEIGRSNVENLYHLLEQRVASQNEATLVQFTAKIIYNDNSSVLLNSLPEFQSYNEVKPLISTALHLSWTYLIKFPNKAFPEKQQVQLTFHTEKAPEFRGEYALRIMFETAFPIVVRIEHTDRTWGADIEALLRGQLEMLQRPVGTFRHLVNKYSGSIGFFTAAVAMIIAFMGAYRISDDFGAAHLARAEQLKKTSSAGSNELLSQQVDFILNLLSSGVWTRFSLFTLLLLVVVLIGCIILGVMVSEKAHVAVPSFITLTARSLTNKQTQINNMRASWFYLAASIIGALLIGVVSNFMFYFALKYLGLPS